MSTDHKIKIHQKIAKKIISSKHCKKPANSEKMQISSQDCKKLHMLKCHRKIREFRRRIVEKSEIQQRVYKTGAKFVKRPPQISSKGRERNLSSIFRKNSLTNIYVYHYKLVLF